MQIALRDERLNRAECCILAVLPERLRNAIAHEFVAGSVEEVRLRINRHVQVITDKCEKLLLDNAVFTDTESKRMLEAICKHSIYAWEDELCNGFVTLEGGARVGICGKPITQNGDIKRFTCVTHYNIRVSREIIGCADSLVAHCVSDGQVVSTLIAAPPNAGKTTLLRDLARQLSNGTRFSSPCKVAIADERSEIAGCENGIPTLDVGVRTDVMEGVSKKNSIFMLIRSMSPDVIITDELGGEQDIKAISEAAKCGVSIIASIHASGIDEICTKQWLKNALKDNVFKRVILVHRSGSKIIAVPVDMVKRQWAE